MIPHRSLLLSVSLLLVTSALAQDPAPPPPATEPPGKTPDLLDPLPKIDLQNPQPGPNPLLPAPLLPEIPPPMVTKPEVRPPELPRKSAGDALRLQIRLRETKTRALKDPGVLAWQERADRARTDQERRAALREYYILLYKNMRRADPSLKPQIDQLELVKLNNLRMWRTNPTEGADKQPAAVVPAPSPPPQRKGGQ